MNKEKNMQVLQLSAFDLMVIFMMLFAVSLIIFTFVLENEGKFNSKIIVPVVSVIVFAVLSFVFAVYV